eukprot:TRINITY_DN32663_c0_g1_i1.p1 TRINITY_DN32663_c0_g1~~TRINITY_DN32663_c0_g1_i1.p1  ORF type:complete len:542 (+),score=124.04 TRINITY_DN32663_c0_g1_i1:75-1700(+)
MAPAGAAASDRHSGYGSGYDSSCARSRAVGSSTASAAKPLVPRLPVLPLSATKQPLAQRTPRGAFGRSQSSRSAPAPATVAQAPTQGMRGVNLTPLLHEALVSTPNACMEALPASYIPTIGRYVQSVEPSRNTVVQNYVPVLMEDEDGDRRAFHVDPLVVRRFQNKVADDLKHVREKRAQMLRRIHDLRREFPELPAREYARRLQREIEDAEERVGERLLRPLPLGTTTLHVLIDVTPHMLQLPLVRERMLHELPRILDEASTRRVTFTALGAHASEPASPSVPPTLDHDEMLRAADEWLQELLRSRHESLDPEEERSEDSRAAIGSHAHHAVSLPLDAALRRSTAASAVGAEEEGLTAVLLIASACPTAASLETCVGLMRRSPAVIHVVGVFGSCPEDPEPALQSLAKAGAPGSCFWLFFGPTYWSNFALSRQRQLAEVLAAAQKEHERRAMIDAASAGKSHQKSLFDEDEDYPETEIVSTKVFEMRLIERIMRECYEEEQRFELELACAARLLERSVVDAEDLLAALRKPHKRPASPKV